MCGIYGHIPQQVSRLQVSKHAVWFALPLIISIIWFALQEQVAHIISIKKIKNEDMKISVEISQMVKICTAS